MRPLLALGRYGKICQCDEPSMSHPAPSLVHIGCSGWNYRHWRGRFYPKGLPVSRWFHFYAETFDTVEINNSFYRLPKASTFEAWREQAPPAFRYAVKANRFLTQAKKLKDCEEPLARMMAPVRSLDDRLGPILYQLPPHFRCNTDRLERFLRLLPGDITHVFEFRDASWHVDGVFDLPDRYGVGFCTHDFPGLATPRLAVGPLAYVRFHGGAGKYWGRYRDEALLERAGWIAHEARAARPVWAFFNNDADAAAVEDALTLRAMLRQAA
jgi:uncharacterized protein YecE (DUF72 family)